MKYGIVKNREVVWVGKANSEEDAIKKSNVKGGKVFIIEQYEFPFMAEFVN